MKILSGNLNGKNIDCCCRCCHASFNLESREDFLIGWHYKPLDKYLNYDFKTMIPCYHVKCPVCGNITYIGFDYRDYDEATINAYGDVIFNRDDWEDRYRYSERQIDTTSDEYKNLFQREYLCELVGERNEH